MWVHLPSSKDVLIHRLREYVLLCFAVLLCIIILGSLIEGINANISWHRLSEFAVVVIIIVMIAITIIFLFFLIKLFRNFLIFIVHVIYWLNHAAILALRIFRSPTIEANLDFIQVSFIEFGKAVLAYQIFQKTNFATLSYWIEFKFSHWSSLLRNIVLILYWIFH